MFTILLIVFDWMFLYIILFNNCILVIVSAIMIFSSTGYIRGKGTNLSWAY